MKKTLLCFMLVTNITFAAKKEARVELTDHGKKLESNYSDSMDNLRNDLRQSIPKVDEEKKKIFQNARKAAKEARIALAIINQSFEEIQKAESLVNHAKNKWIAGADKKILNATEMLNNAKNDAEREAAEKELAKSQENRKAGVQALEERQGLFDKAKQKEPKLVKQREEAQKAIELAQTEFEKAAKNLNPGELLSSDSLDGKLAKFVVLSKATPYSLAAFSQKGEENEKLVEKLLSDEKLMLTMLSAGGAKEAKYGKAMKIYTDIRKVSKQAGQPGILQNLALGISLEMTVPYKQGYGTFLSRGLKPVDPVERYLHYEKAFLAGELDPNFKEMSAWECRWIASDPESNETLAWLRTTICNYRPDMLGDSDSRRFYSGIIKTDVAYRRHKWDNSGKVSKIQQAIDKGGICHIRAWIARSTARAFGIPALRVEEGGAKSPLEKGKK